MFQPSYTPPRQPAGWHRANQYTRAAYLDLATRWEEVAAAALDRLAEGGEAVLEDFGCTLRDQARARCRHAGDPFLIALAKLALRRVDWLTVSEWVLTTAGCWSPLRKGGA